MTYLDSTLERNILSKHCMPQLVANLVSVADRMRDSNGSYRFERPPAPEELLTGGHYISKLIQWNKLDFAWVGKNVWALLALELLDLAIAVSARLRVAHIQLKSGLLGTEVEST